VNRHLASLAIAPITLAVALAAADPPDRVGRFLERATRGFQSDGAPADLAMDDCEDVSIQASKTRCYVAVIQLAPHAKPAIDFRSWLREPYVGGHAMARQDLPSAAMVAVSLGCPAVTGKVVLYSASKGIEELGPGGVLVRRQTQPFTPGRQPEPTLGTGSLSLQIYSREATPEDLRANAERAAQDERDKHRHVPTQAEIVCGECLIKRQQTCNPGIEPEARCERIFRECVEDYGLKVKQCY
jgi:hypothetical protein